MHETGEVRLAFTQAKTILNLFRELALGKKEPYDELCRLFDHRTEQGGDMRLYSELLASVVESTAGVFQTRLASGLQNSRSFVLPTADAQPQRNSEFELITWLVILASPCA